MAVDVILLDCCPELGDHAVRPPEGLISLTKGADWITISAEAALRVSLVLVIFEAESVVLAFPVLSRFRVRNVGGVEE